MKVTPEHIQEYRERMAHLYDIDFCNYIVNPEDVIGFSIFMLEKEWELSRLQQELLEKCKKLNIDPSKVG